MGAERARSDVVDHEAQMVNARVARRVPGTLARVLSPGLEDREIDVPVGKVHARSRLADLLQAEHVLVEGRGLLGVRSANGDVLDPGHWTSFLSSFLRRRHPPRDLLPGLLKLARQVGVPPLEVLLLFLKPQNLGTQPPELAAQRFDVGAVAVGLRRRPRRRCRHPSDRDLLVGRPVLLSSRRGIPGPLDASAHLMALLERDGAGRDFPLMGLVPRLRIVEAVADMELVGEDRKGRLRIRAATRRSSHSAHHRPRTITTPEASRIAITTLATVKTARRLARRRTRLPGGRAVLEDHAFRSVPPSGAPDLLPLPPRLRQRRLHHRACDRVPAHLKDGTDEALDAEPRVLPAGVSHARHRS